MSHPNMSTSLSAQDLLEKMQADNAIDEKDKSALAKYITQSQGKSEMPIYIRILVGVGAFFSSIFFIGFLAVVKIIDFDSAGGLIFFGLLFMTGAYFLLKMAEENDETVFHSFMTQCSFCSIAIGKVFFVAGLTTAFEKQAMIPLASLIVTLFTYNLYKMFMDRFLSSTATLLAFMAWIVSEYDIRESREILLCILFLIEMGGASYLLTSRKLSRVFTPLSYAFAFSLCAFVWLITVEENVFSPPAFIFMNVVLTVAFIGLIGWAAGGAEKLKKESLLIACGGAVILGFISSPGILLSLALLVVGYARHDRILTQGGALLLPIYLLHYYYNIDLTLAEKSAVLIFSGAVLLAGRFYLRWRQLDREVAA